MNFRLLWPLAAVLALLMGAACQDKAEEFPPTSGIQGQVLVGPTCPVEREDLPCPDRPLSATVEVWNADHSRRITTFTTDAQGYFRVPLPPGEYYVEPQAPNAGGPPLPVPQTMTVRQNVYITLTIQYDSGIR